MQVIRRTLGRSSTWTSTFALLAAFSPSTLAQLATPRQVAAPASDIVSGLVRLPDPAAASTVSSAAVMPLRFERAQGGGWSAELTLPIDRAGAVSLALLSADAGMWRMFVRAPGAEMRPIAQAFALEHRTGLVGDELPGWVVDRYDLRAAPAGSWTVRVEAASERVPSHGWLIAKTASDVRIETYVTTQQLVGGEPIAIVARASGADVTGARSRGASAAVVEHATLRIDVDGQDQQLEMFDDGLHEDQAGGDGLFGAFVPESVRGDVRAHVEISGTTRDALQFVRSTQLSFPVLEQRVLLDGSVRASVVDERHLELALGALALGPAQQLHVSAEVWGRNAADESVPVCWLSRQIGAVELAGADARAGAGAWSLPLVLDLRWLDVADARAPLELRHVRVQDPDTEVVFDRRDRIALEIVALPSGIGPSPSGVGPLRSTVGPGSQEITSQMLTGGTSLSLSLGASTPAGTHTRISHGTTHPGLMLVHGYCSGGGVWPAADFTQPKLGFNDPNANRTHDQFAQLIAQQAQAGGFASFGIVGHSQGGPASLHLLTYYQTGLDLASGGRRIQSVASPYQGTPLASLGSFACGVNNDMTPAGSATWLAGIPSWARAEVYFWTTSNSGSACNFFTGLLLTDPEDGTVEKFRGDLPGANSMGHVVGWCHTTGMSNPANYTDHVRNQAMNAAAAR